MTVANLNHVNDPAGRTRDLPGRPISRAEAIRIATVTLESAERGRIEAAEQEAKAQEALK
jgi:hypothetical protein